jgi:hypothetical protein
MFGDGPFGLAVSSLADLPGATVALPGATVALPGDDAAKGF